MSKVYDIEISVISQKGQCSTGHKVGDHWIIRDTTPAGICLSAYPLMERAIEVMKYGGAYPWSKDPNIDITVCPDPQNPVVFQLKRIVKP
jgi:uncharacterized repeat protein (TIGR04076 family)